MDKEFYGYLSLVLTVAAYTPYVWSILRGETRPHVFSWVIWGLLLTIATAGQYVGGAGPGWWATALSAFMNILIAVLALKYGERNITRRDWMVFIAALSAIPLWLATNNPLAAIILVTAIDLLAYAPTFRKAWHKPYEEMPLLYILCNFEYAASFSAMLTYSFLTLLYPTALLIANSALVTVIYIQRKKHANVKAA